MRRQVKIVAGVSGNIGFYFPQNPNRNILWNSVLCVTILSTGYSYFVLCDSWKHRIITTLFNF